MAHPPTLAGPRELDIRSRAQLLALRRLPSGAMSEVQRDRQDLLDILNVCRTALIVARVQLVAAKKDLAESRRSVDA